MDGGTGEGIPVAINTGGWGTVGGIGDRGSIGRIESLGSEIVIGGERRMGSEIVIGGMECSFWEELILWINKQPRIVRGGSVGGAGRGLGSPIKQWK